jgi:hypothetical protein
MNADSCGSGSTTLGATSIYENCHKQWNGVFPYLGMIPGSVKDVLSRLDSTKTKRTADTTGIAVDKIIQQIQNLI